MKITSQYVQNTFRDFSVFISKTPISGKHEVHFTTGAGEFVLRMTLDELDSSGWLFNRAYTDIDKSAESRQEKAA